MFNEKNFGCNHDAIILFTHWFSRRVFWVFFCLGADVMDIIIDGHKGLVR